MSILDQWCKLGQLVPSPGMLKPRRKRELSLICMANTSLKKQVSKWSHVCTWDQTWRLQKKPCRTWHPELQIWLGLAEPGLAGLQQNWENWQVCHWWIDQRIKGKYSLDDWIGRKFQQRNRNYRKNEMETLDWKVNKMKNSLGGLKSGFGIAEIRVSEF